MQEVERLGGDRSNTVWFWFVHRGPHGRDFSWSQTKQNPSGYVGVEHLERIIQEEEMREPGFVEQTRQVVGKAFDSDDCDFVRRAVQIGAIVGEQAELERIIQLATHENDDISKDARAAMFYMKKRLRSKN